MSFLFPQKQYSSPPPTATSPSYVTSTNTGRTTTDHYVRNVESETKAGESVTSCLYLKTDRSLDKDDVLRRIQNRKQTMQIREAVQSRLQYYFISGEDSSSRSHWCTEDSITDAFSSP